MLDSETRVNGVTTGKLRAELKVIGVPARVGGGSLNPSSELDVTARWGIAGKGGVCMPGKSKAIERAYTPYEQTALTADPPLRAWARRRSMCISTMWPSGVAYRRACGLTR